MSFKNIFAPMGDMIEFRKIINAVTSNKRIVEVNGISDVQKALLAIYLRERFDCSVLIVTPDDIVSKKLQEDVATLDNSQALLFPSRDISFYKIDARSSEQRRARIDALSSVLGGGNQIVIATAPSLMNRLMNPDIFERDIITIDLNSKIEMDSFINKLIFMGYERVASVEGVGQFSVRGGILDIYATGCENATRIELFDDEVDSIRSFDILTQRSTDKVDEIRILPVQEILLKEDDYKRATALVKKECNASKNPNTVTNISYDIERLEQGQYFEGIDRYIPYLLENSYSLFDYMGECIVIVDEASRIKQSAEHNYTTFLDQYKDLLSEGKLLPSQANIIFSDGDFLDKVCENRVITTNTILKSDKDFPPQEIVHFATRSMQAFHGKTDMLIEEIAELKRRGYTTLIFSGNPERGKRLAQLLNDNEIYASYKDALDIELVEGHIIVLPGSLSGSFEIPSIKYAIISDREYFSPKSHKRKIKRENAISNFSELKVGDFVVHDNHGIGKYLGIEKITIDKTMRDYLHIQYHGSDKLFIPTDQLDMIQKYIGNKDKMPKLNRLGGVEWGSTKLKAKASIDDIAQDLIKLYAKRREAVGYPFAKDTEWQKEFEEFFPYEMTGDQMLCINEIKSDMESNTVMDRLLCGDVGYGKTEVALRAAFKAAVDSKQVAILVPTTILAQQHYNTAKERFAGFPIGIGLISRFKTAKEQTNTLKDLKAGTIDIIIGTHKLLNDKVVYKDLGLLIIDEEQRFGVKHKEKIKQVSENVDVLTLTATPIPRTLHMSMTGIRDISVINEPPEERYPVQTYVIEYNDDIIRDAIRREMGRGGQVYFLYNKVKTINSMANKLMDLVPEARVAVGHGQMAEGVMEKTMLDFYNNEYDVLVSTTIIESGLDISNVNTILIYDADKLGLAQLYQLRGRVGRSNRQAHAYLMYQRDKVLSEEAEKRLTAIKEFTEFGSGFKIAMRDLEIRGGGDLLGASQSGHMESVGYDLYIRLLEEKLQELKGEVITPKNDTNIDILVNAHIPEKYIIDPEQKIEVYKKIAGISTYVDFMDIQDELIDRFGDIPESVNTLLNISYIRAIARVNGITSITLKGQNIILRFANWSYAKDDLIDGLTQLYRGRVFFTPSENPYITYRVGDKKAELAIEDIKEMMEYIKEVNLSS